MAELAIFIEHGTDQTIFVSSNSVTYLREIDNTKLGYESATQIFFGKDHSVVVKNSIRDAVRALTSPGHT